MLLETTMPTVARLVADAVADGDFFNDVAPGHDLARLAAEYAARGAEIWEDANDVLSGTVPRALVAAAGAVLARLADDLRPWTTTS